MTLNLAILGQTGQLARALDHALKQRTKGQAYTARFYNRDACDLSQSPEYIEEFIGKIHTPDVLVIAAAYTAVDGAETNSETAHAVNGAAPTAIAKACARHNIPLIHISTDYVFAGTAITPYKVNAPTNPVNVYGASKLAGEQGILKSNCHAAILRTSWVYDGVGKNFLTTMLRLAQTHAHLDVVADQIGRPTYAGHLATAVLQTAQALHTTHKNKNSNLQNLYHVTGTGQPISWADFAKSIFALAENDLPHKMSLNDIPTKDFPTPAARPAYSMLDVSAFERAHNCTLPHWHDGLKTAYSDWADRA